MGDFDEARFDQALAYVLQHGTIHVLSANQHKFIQLYKDSRMNRPCTSSALVIDPSGRMLVMAIIAAIDGGSTSYFASKRAEAQFNQIKQTYELLLKDFNVETPSVPAAPLAVDTEIIVNQ